MKRSEYKKCQALNHAAMSAVSFIAATGLTTCAAMVTSDTPSGGWALLTLAIVALLFAVSLALESARLFRVSKQEEKSERLRGIRHPHHFTP